MMRLASFLVAALASGSLPGFANAAEILANRTLRVGDILAPGDISASVPSDEDRVSDWIGMEVRRAVYAGHKVLAGHLGPPTLVHRNDIVSMTFRSGALGLRAEGRALGAGGQGERIEVMNLDSRLVVRALVTGVRQVEVRR